VTGLAGGIAGAAVTAALGELGVRTGFTPVAGETRRTFTVVDERREAAAFHEPGPAVGAAEFAGFLDDYRAALAAADAVVLSGSLPPGLPDRTYATLIAAASDAGVPAVLDAHGEALRLGTAAGPAIVKPNLSELEALTGRPLALGADVMAAACGLRSADAHGDSGRRGARAHGAHGAHGAQAVVVTLGRDGMLAVTGEGCWRARPPAAVAGNATGAGDAVAAALAHGLVLGRPWDERLRHAVALGAATAAAPVAGEFRSGYYTGALAAVTVEQVSAEEVG